MSRPGPKPRPPAERFSAMVDRRAYDECWPWLGSQTKGYGSFDRAYAHRFAYELANGPIPVGLHIDHLCRTPICCNPAHLEAVTQAENNRRMGAAVTHCVNGHEYTDANTYRSRNGRRCRTCHRAAVARSARRKRSAA